MKKIIISMIFVLTVLSCAGQNYFRYPLQAYGGLTVGGIYKGYYPVLIDSITSTAGDIKFWSGGAALTAVPGVGSGTWGAITGTLANQIDLALALSLKADLVSPIFTGTPVVPGYVPTSRTVNGHALSGNVTVTATDVGLGNVTNESKATMFTNPLFTGTPTVPGYVPTSTTVNGHALTGNISVAAADVSLGNVTNESKATMFTSPTFTGHPTIEGITATGATGTGNLVFSNSPVFTTPNIGTATGSITGNAATVTTNANLTGVVTSVGNATSFAASPVFTGTVTIPSPFTLGATSVTANGTELNVLDNIPGTLTSTELGYVDGVTSAIQTQINAKNFEEFQLIVGVDAEAPIAGDSTLTHTHFDGMFVLLQRDGTEPRLNTTATNTYEGYRHTTSILTVNPVWQANEQIRVRIYSTTIRTVILPE